MTLTERIKRPTCDCAPALIAVHRSLRTGTPWRHFDWCPKARKPQPEPTVERMSPFMRKLRAKQLDAKVLYNGAYVPSGEDGAA